MGTYDSAVAIAAVAVLATQGGRGFTHRAVDRQAGLPDGTASRYARTREALLDLAADELFAADRTATQLSIDQAPVELLMQVTHRLLQAPDRFRARLELQLEAHRAPALRQHFERARSAFVTALANQLELSRTSSDLLVLAMDGVLHRQIVLAQPPLPRRHLESLFEALLSKSDATPPRAVHRTADQRSRTS